MTEQEYQKYKEVKEKLVLTHHGKDNLRERRKDIPVKDIIKAISFGQLGFAGGGGRYKSTYNGVEVIYKRSHDDKIVVITQYRVKKNKQHKLFEHFGII